MNQHSNPLAEPLRELLIRIERCRAYAPEDYPYLNAAVSEAKRELRAADLADAEQKRKSA